jgi:hypothetical protein
MCAGREPTAAPVAGRRAKMDRAEGLITSFCSVSH